MTTYFGKPIAPGMTSPLAPIYAYSEEDGVRRLFGGEWWPVFADEIGGTALKVPTWADLEGAETRGVLRRLDPIVGTTHTSLGTVVNRTANVRFFFLAPHADLDYLRDHAGLGAVEARVGHITHFRILDLDYHHVEVADLSGVKHTTSTAPFQGTICNARSVVFIGASAPAASRKWVSEALYGQNPASKETRRHWWLGECEVPLFSAREPYSWASGLRKQAVVAHSLWMTQAAQRARQELERKQAKEAAEAARRDALLKGDTTTLGPTEFAKAVQARLRARKGESA